MENSLEINVCLKCGQSDIDEFQTCTKCDITNLVPISEYKRWCKIKGTFQLFTGNDNQEPSVIIPLHLNKMGWIVANVVNTEKTIFPSLDHIVGYDKAIYDQLLTKHRIADYTRRIEFLKGDSNAG